MKAFRARYNSGDFKDKEFYVVFATTESEALGLALESEIESNADDWEIIEIKCKGAVHIGTDYGFY